MSSRNHLTDKVLIIGLIVVVLFCIGLQLQLLALNRQQSWVSTLQLVSQPGCTKAYVIRWMGKPDLIMSPREALQVSKDSYATMSIPKRTSQVLYYEQGFTGWMGYVFVTGDGKVLGYRLRST